MLAELANGVWIFYTGPIHRKIVIDYITLDGEKVFESAIVDLSWLIKGACLESAGFGAMVGK